MFDKTLKNIIINTYKYLKDSLNIIGQNRIDFITNNYKCHITTLYGWNKEFKNNSNSNDNIYNKNINPLLENIIYKCITEYKITSVKKIKKYININFNQNINQKTINFILKKNNLECEKYKIKKEINNFIINEFTEYKITTAKEIIEKVFIKYNIKLSESSIYDTLKQNKITYKKIKIKTNPCTVYQNLKVLINNIDNETLSHYLYIRRTKI
jgi:transposase